MPVLRERALLIFEEDLRNLELLKTLKAKMVTQMLPPHRYDGSLTFGQSLIFEGKELLRGEKFRLTIPLSSIVDLHLGYDDFFVGKDSKGKKYQLTPVRIKYKQDDTTRTMYIFAEYKRLFRSSSGEEFYKALESKINI
ncbi:MAG: hypothetical protein ACE5J2_07295 [Nitrososphaerales archaeon]